MKPLPDEMRQEFCRALEAGQSIKSTAAAIGISRATADRWARSWRENGAVPVGKIGGHKRYLLDSERAWLAEKYLANPDLTLHGTVRLLAETRGVKVCVDTLWRYLRHCEMHGCCPVDESAAMDALLDKDDAGRAWPESE